MSGRGTLNRRQFLGRSALGAVGLAGGLIGLRHLGVPLPWPGDSAGELPFPVRMRGASAKAGHLLRDRSASYPEPSRTERARVAIVGAGIAGLSAAWKLDGMGERDYVVLELEPESGGNSQSGVNEISAHPWGAHYVPLPGEDAVHVRELFEELGVITGRDSRGQPVYEEEYLCADPEDRLLIHGHWQEGLVPRIGLKPGEQAQFGSFFAEMERYRRARGPDGRRAFAIPVDLSSRDPRFTALDRMTMAELMRERGWDSPHLRWYVNYCCRDDYGCRMEDVSAWAGVHYFASREGKQEGMVLTWPEGNGWIARKLADQAGKRVRGNALATRIRRAAGGGYEIDWLDVRTRLATRLHADAVVFAAPRFVAARVIEPLNREVPGYLADFTYAPWLVANVTLKSLPGGPGAPLSWDNVSYDSPSLGYIVATHQSLASQPTETVITYYQALSDEAPADARRAAHRTAEAEWAKRILADLSRMHPGIESEVSAIDLWLWGHGMIRPTPGFVWGRSRQAALEPLGGIFFAHSDMSGVSIFEEANYRGVEAAAQAAAYLRGRARGLAS